MVATTYRSVRISPWISIPLSGLMILVSILNFTGVENGDGPEWPVFTSFRDPKSMLNILNHRRLTTPAWLFQGAKGLASIGWCITIPLQHNQKIRSRWPAIHRMIGYVVILLSIDLGLAGLWMLVNGMVTSHQNAFHVHTLDPFPLVAWPTFSMTTAILSVPYFLSLVRLYIAIKSKQIESHRKWAVFHSMCGYFIAIARVMGLAVTFLGWVLQFIPEDIKTQWLQVPSTIDAILAAEVSALAWTLASAACVTVFWTWYEWTQAGLVGSRQRLVGNKQKKAI